MAVVPLSLVTIGLSLQQYGVRGSVRPAAVLSLVKLVVHPALVYVAAWLRPDRAAAGGRGALRGPAVRRQRAALRRPLRRPQAETTATIVVSTTGFVVTVT